MFGGVDEWVCIDPVVDELHNRLRYGLHISVFKQRTGIDILPDNKYRWTDPSYFRFMGDIYVILNSDCIVR